MNLTIKPWQGPFPLLAQLHAHINDYEVLLITPDTTLPVGYSYKVRVCGSPVFPAGVTGRALESKTSPVPIQQ